MVRMARHSAPLAALRAAGRARGFATALAFAAAIPYPVRVEKNVEARMPEGIVLRADVYRPDAPGRFPALLKRTPYSKAASSEVPLFERLASRGYVVAVQDTRGRYTSDGVARPHDEAADGRDTVAWLAALPYVDGKVGMFGGSYAATTQLTAASLAPEALVALFPSSSYASRYDMVYEGGAFYLLDGLRWNLGQSVDVRRRRLEPEVSRDGPIGLSEEESERVRERWVWHVPLETVDVAELSNDAPGYFEMLAHPSYDTYWMAYDIAKRHQRFRTPALHLTGWYDSLLVGTLRNYEGLRRHAATEAARSGQRLVVGPWTHARPTLESRRIGDVDFGPDAGIDSQALLETWFDYWLKSEDNGALEGAPVRIFVMGENRWRDETEWPLSRAREASVYLREGGSLSFEAPGEGEAPERYVYDPWNPVPTPSWAGYSRAPMDTTGLDAREDVLVYTSDPLEAPIEVTGYLELELFVASSATDTDFTARLLDVGPDGRARALGDGILRARYRDGFSEPKLLTPGEPTRLRIELGATSNLFLAGHRLRLELSSSNFPRFDRNPNTGGVVASAVELRRAEQTVFHDPARPSRLVLPVVPREAASRLLGFTVEASRVEREREHGLERNLSETRLSELHRRLTARPHRAGTPGAEATATYLANALESAGFDVEVVEYEAYLSAPKRVSATMLSPERLELELDEPPSELDPESAHPELEPGFIAYSGSGRVEGELVELGYGLPPDYEGKDVRGKIALVRYGRSHRAVKVATAEARGALGILIESDPADDGAGKGSVWPEGPWRAPFQLQRGNAKLSWFWHGDPLTPGAAATPQADRLDPAEAPTLPGIPALPLSAKEAAKLLDALSVGPVRVRLDVKMDDGLRTIRNVLGTLRGRSEPERRVLLGTHHDAWTFGGVDPGSATATLLELGHALGALAREGWRPERSIQLCFWDAEEYGLVGSTELAEDRIAELRERAVVYLNTDMINGERLSAGGTPTLRDFVREVASAVPGVDPPEDLNALGSGADFVPFQDFVGLPTLSLELLFEGGWGFGTYHSNYDDRYWMSRHVGFEPPARLARLLGIAALRLADAPVLPYRFSTYGETMQGFVGLAEEWSEGVHRFESLRGLASGIRDKAAALEKKLDAALAEGRLPADRAALNDGLMRLEQALIDETEPPDERWYRHVVYGWNIYALYSGQPFPGLAAAITRGTNEDVRREAARIERAFERVSVALDRLLGLTI